MAAALGGGFEVAHGFHQIAGRRRFRLARVGRMRIISENIANADSVAQTPGGDLYRRRIVTFASELDRTIGAKVVTLGPVDCRQRLCRARQAARSDRQ